MANRLTIVCIAFLSWLISSTAATGSAKVQVYQDLTSEFREEQALMDLAHYSFGIQQPDGSVMSQDNPDWYTLMELTHECGEYVLTASNHHDLPAGALVLATLNCAQTEFHLRPGFAGNKPCLQPIDLPPKSFAH